MFVCVSVGMCVCVCYVCLCVFCVCKCVVAECERFSTWACAARLGLRCGAGSALWMTCNFAPTHTYILTHTNTNSQMHTYYFAEVLVLAGLWMMC